MSEKTSAREIADRRLCQICHQRPARFRFRGKVKRDADHDICFQCYRRVITQAKAAIEAARSIVES
jgi:hypothetical protein